jgi:hypothetical protein
MMFCNVTGISIAVGLSRCVNGIKTPKSRSRRCAHAYAHAKCTQLPVGVKCARRKPPADGDAISTCCGCGGGLGIARSAVFSPGPVSDARTHSYPLAHALAVHSRRSALSSTARGNTGKSESPHSAL